MTTEEAINTLKNAAFLGSEKALQRDSDAVDMAIEALKKSEKYGWHDIRKNPEDLPQIGTNYADFFTVCLDGKDKYGLKYWHFIDTRLYNFDGTWDTDKGLKVIAWRETETFEEET